MTEKQQEDQTPMTTATDAQAELSNDVQAASPKRRGRPPSKKTAGKKKVSKKKTSKKKASKKKRSNKKSASRIGEELQPESPRRKKKTSKKKRSKKKRGRRSAAAIQMQNTYGRLLDAVNELQAAVTELAETQRAQQASAFSDVREMARSKMEEFEKVALTTIRKLGL